VGRKAGRSVKADGTGQRHMSWEILSERSGSIQQLNIEV